MNGLRVDAFRLLVGHAVEAVLDVGPARVEADDVEALVQDREQVGAVGLDVRGRERAGAAEVEEQRADLVASLVAGDFATAMSIVPARGLP